MSDDRLRELERAARSGDHGASLRLVRDRERRGEMLPDIVRPHPFADLIWARRTTDLRRLYRLRFMARAQGAPSELTISIGAVTERIPIPDNEWTVVSRAFMSGPASVKIEHRAQDAPVLVDPDSVAWIELR